MIKPIFNTGMVRAILDNRWCGSSSSSGARGRKEADMDYKELVDKLREKDGCHCECIQAADAIETLLAERDAAVADLTTLGQDSGDSCHLCRNLPCVNENGEGHCLGFVWRGPQKGDG